MEGLRAIPECVLRTIYGVPWWSVARHPVLPPHTSPLEARFRKVLTTTDFLDALHRRGATRISCVRFRNNRSTVWSLTQRGTVLNVHAAFRRADPPLLDAFATLGREGEVGSPRAHEASDRIMRWPPLHEAIAALRHAHDHAAARRGTSATACCATDAQRAYLRRLYDYFNATRFENRLPSDIPIRLSNRMKSSLGHMRVREHHGRAGEVSEIALNIDLMLEGNGAERADTLLHEMAHVADYLESGHAGHGPSWRAWARRVGCRPTTLYDRPVRQRRPRSRDVDRVPPLPPAIADLTVGAGG